jgi:hypothetical protein
MTNFVDEVTGTKASQGIFHQEMTGDTEPGERVGNLRVKPLVACSDTVRDYSDHLKHIHILDFARLCQDTILYYTGILTRLILTLQVDCIHPYSPIPTWQTTSVDLSICFV